MSAGPPVQPRSKSCSWWVVSKSIADPVWRAPKEWVDFQVMRATHASIGHRLKLDPKVTADQRGHGVGVAIEEYTKTSVKDKAVAAKKLEEAVLGKEKIVRMPPRKAS